MSIISWVGQKIGLRDGKFWSAFFGTETWAGEPISHDTAMQLGAFWACLRINARTISTLPLGLYERQEDGTRKSRSDHDLYKIIHTQPNADQTAVVFWEGMIAWLLLNGTSMAPKQFRGSGPSRTLIGLDRPLDPRIVTVERLKSGQLVFKQRETSGFTEYAEDDIFVLRGFGLGGDLGLSPLQYARQSLSSARATDRAAASHFANGMRPSGWLVFKGGTLEPSQRALAKQNIINPMVGAENWGKIGILEGEFDYKQMTIEPEAAQLLESRRFSVEDICRWTGTPPILIGHAGQGQTMWGCLPAGTRVLTAAGPVPIEDVRVGATVWTLDADRMVRRRVLRSGQTGVKPLYTIKTRDRTVRATANHQFLVRRKRLAEQAGRRAIEWRNEWIAAEDLTTADYIVAAHDVAGGEEFGRVAPSGRIVNEWFMEFCGLYLAEGSMNDRHVTIARHKDAAYMDAYREAMRAEFTRSTARLVVNGGLAPVHLMESERATTFSSKAAVDELVELGFAGTAHTKRIPGWIFGLSRSLQLAFLRGYLDGDGHVNRHGWITWTSVNRDLIEDVRHLCIVAGVPVGEACDYPIPLWFDGSERETPGTVWQAWSFSVPHNRHIGSHDPRYLDRWARVAEPMRVGRFDPSYVGRGCGAARPGLHFSIQGAVLSRIISIDKGQEAEAVFDLEIEGTHNFVADGVVVHNSGVSEIMNGWYKTSLRADLVRIEQEIPRQLLSRQERQMLYAEYSLEGLLRANTTERMDSYWKLYQMGVINADWIADKENIERPPNGHRYFVNQTLAVLDENGVPMKATTEVPAGRRAEDQNPPQPAGPPKLEVVQ